jgi:hypothetical protein
LSRRFPEITASRQGGTRQLRDDLNRLTTSHRGDLDEDKDEITVANRTLPGPRPGHCAEDGQICSPESL